MSHQAQTMIGSFRFDAVAITSTALAAAGTATAIHFRHSTDHWRVALVGWTIGWVFSLVAIAFWQGRRGRLILGRETRDQPRWRSPEIVALVLLLAVATALRVVAVENLPIHLHNDEMSCFLEARPFLAQGQGLFDTGWFACPRLGFFLTSIPMRIFGPTLFALRLSSAVLGVVSLLAAYLLVRRLFGVQPAILLLLFTTPFHWHLHYSRAGFHYMQAGALTVVALWLFVTATDRRSPLLFGCAGVAAGIAFQTYYAAWLLPIILVAWSAGRWLSDRGEGSIALRGLVVTAALFAVTTAPLLAHYATRPQSATSRTEQVFLLSERNHNHVSQVNDTESSVKILLLQADRLVRFFFGKTGDLSVQYGLQGRFIDPFMLWLVIAGILYSLILLRTAGGQLLWLWIGGTVIAGGLLTIDAPFTPRLITITPILLLFPTLLIDRVLRLKPIVGHRWVRSIALAAVAALVIASGWWNLQTTFITYPQQRPGYRRDQIVRLAAGLDNVESIINLIETPEDFSHQAYLALVPNAVFENIPASGRSPDELFSIIEALPGSRLVIFPPQSPLMPQLLSRLHTIDHGTIEGPGNQASLDWIFAE